VTGFFLAGIYPVGMKIAADHFQAGLGKSLGFLVGALVLGTAFPHLLRGALAETPWVNLVITTSALAVTGGILLVSFVPDGPFRKPTQRTNLVAFVKVFQRRGFRSAAFGYFGHMWELYAFWAFIPVLLTTYQSHHPAVWLNIPLLSFVVIAAGFLSCIAAGYLADYLGTRNTAGFALGLSGTCCILSPVIIISAPAPLMIAFLIVWGASVVADSPMFSTLVATQADPKSRGTALTIVNCIGFSITIISIQLLTYLNTNLSPAYLFTILSVGPLFGLAALFRRKSGLSNR
jgi:MFS family permease